MGKTHKCKAFILILIVSIVFVASCAAGEKTVAIALGTIDGSVYENEYLGIGCQFDGWHIYNSDELQGMNSFAIDKLSQDLKSILQKQSSIIIMFAETPDKKINVNISVSYEQDAGFQVELFGMEKTISMFHNQILYDLQQKWGQSVSLMDINATIGNETFYGYDITYIAHDQTVYMRQVMIAKEDYMFSISVTADSIEQLECVYAQFYLLEDKKEISQVTDIVDLEQLEFQKCLLSAIGGDTSAEYEVGWYYECGIGVKQDYNEAMKWYRKAAGKGYPAAQSQIGWLYFHGLGVERNYEEAIKWSLKAAEQGNAIAQNNLGYAYAHGEGVEQNYEEAIKWYLKAIEQGNDSAQNNLGYAYAHGEGVEQNYEEAFKWYLKAAEQGNDSAQYNVGYAYDYGQGVEQSNEEAFKWYLKAAEQGNAPAQNNIGYAYDYGLGVEQNYEEAFKWYMKAAELGNKVAMENVGWCYENGNGVEKNAEEAQRWYDMAK